MTDSRLPDDTSGWGERRLRRLAERLAQEEAEGRPPEQTAMTRRQLRQAQRLVEQSAEQAAGPRGEDEDPQKPERVDARAEPKPEKRAPDAEEAQPPTGPPTAPPPVPSITPAPSRPPTPTRPKSRRPVVRPPASARRADEPSTGPIPVVRVEASTARQRQAARDAAREAARPQPADRPARSVVPQKPVRPQPRWVWLLALVAVGVVAVVAVLAWQAREPEGSAQQGPTGAASQRTLAMGLTDDAGKVSGAALLGTDGSTSSALLIPSRLLVDVAGGGRVPVADSLTTGDAALGQSVEDALDVRVDGTWVLSSDGLRDLVDELGGIAMDVETSVSTETVAIPAGPGQRLDGLQAVTYATFLGPDEPETARSARLSQVIGAVLAVLPQEPGEVESLLLGLADGSRVTQDVADVGEVLVQLASTAVAGSFGATVLPVQEIATGGDQVVYGLDDAELGAVLESRFAGALRPGSEDAVRVLVQNGVGTPGLGEQARERLVEAGFRYLGGGNATTLGRETTVVAIATDSQRDRDRGAAVADALGLSPDVVAVGRDAPTLADVVVVLGEDFAALGEQSP